MITSNRCVLKKSAVILLEISKLIPLDQADREREKKRERKQRNMKISKREIEYLVANVISIQLVSIKRFYTIS